VAPGVASADPKTLRPIVFDCGSTGEFVYAGKQPHLQPMGELNGRKVKVSNIWVEVASFGSAGFIIAEWPVPRAPNLTAVGCEAHYVIPGDPADPFDHLFVGGYVTIHVPAKILD
jgi:hypothetical protein